jgi:hypothetical protein
LGRTSGRSPEALKLTVPCSLAGVRTSSMVGLTRFVPLVMKRRGVETLRHRLPLSLCVMVLKIGILVNSLIAASTPAGSFEA